MHSRIKCILNLAFNKHYDLNNLIMIDIYDQLFSKDRI